MVIRSGSRSKSSAAEHFAGAAEAGDHLVGDQQNVILLEYRLDLLEIGCRWQDHAACAHQWLGDECADCVRPLTENQALQLRSETRSEHLLGLARLRMAIVVRASGVKKALERQTEVPVDVRQSAQAGARQGGAMVGALARDDPALVRLADGMMVVAHQLDRRIIGLRARGGEQHLGHRHGRHREQALREFNRRAVRLAAEQ